MGGIERFAESLAGWLLERGNEVIVVTSTSGPPGDRGYPVLRRPSQHRLREIARRADVVHVNGLSLRGVGVGLAARRPTLVTHAAYQAVCPTGLSLPTSGTCTAGPARGPCRVCPERGVKGEVDVRIHATVCGRVTANVAISHYIMSRLGLVRSRMIYNPVSKAAFDAVTSGPGEDGLIVFAGRLVREKGVENLLRALPRVPDARLDVVGDGPMLHEYRDLTAQLGLSSRVSFLGSQPFGGLADAYSRAAAVCIPSLQPVG
jgi:glycosyltransferase involved in cell wall biosynthesis